MMCHPLPNSHTEWYFKLHFADIVEKERKLLFMTLNILVCIQAAKPTCSFLPLKRLEEMSIVPKHGQITNIASLFPKVYSY